MTQDDRDRAEVETVLNFALDFAQQCLRRYSGFDPFGGFITMDGEMRKYAVLPGDADNPQDLRDLLVEGLSGHAAASRAVWYCTDGLTQESDDGPTLDAIILHIEHWRWGASKLSMTYKRRRWLNRYEYGELSRTRVDPLFPNLASDSNYDTNRTPGNDRPPSPRG